MGKTRKKIKSLVVYTVIFGNYDNLVEPKEKQYLKEQADFVLFTDSAQIKSDLFDVRVVNKPNNDPIRANRFFKILSHQVLSKYDYTLYFDGNIVLASINFHQLISKYLNGYDFAAFKHPFRKCLYHEAEWVSKSGLDRQDIIDNQIETYVEEGFPSYFGLTAGTILLRRHTSNIIEFNLKWWYAYKKGSRRDQLSLDYARWKTGIRINYISEPWDNNFIGKRIPHQKPQNKVKKSRFNSLKIPLKGIKYLIDKKYRLKINNGRFITSEIQRLNNLDSKVPFSTNILGSEIKALDKTTFLYMYKEIFREKIYEFIPSSLEGIYIIDGGANIGLASIFFKMTYPLAEIIAFEADTKIAEICKENLNSFGFYDINVIKKALWNREGLINFLPDGNDSGRISLENNDNLVSTVVLSNYLSKKVDLLKLDIEGAELLVLEEIKSKLHLVQNLFIEYHSFSMKEQSLENVLAILKASQFRYILHSPSKINPTPFKTDLTRNGMEFHVNIFATKYER